MLKLSVDAYGIEEYWRNGNSDWTAIAILSSTSSHCVAVEKRVLYAEEQQ